MELKNSNEKFLLSPQQASDFLGGIGINTLNVWRCTKRYPLPYVKIGRKVFYKKTDLENFIDSRTQNNNKEEA